MKTIWIIAKNTYREIIRDRILYGLLVFAVLMFGFSLALGELSFAEQGRISADFGLTAIHLSSVILAIFVGSTLVTKEIDKKTILTLLARPISRLHFILGKYLGLALIILTVLTGLAFILAGVFALLNFPLDLSYPMALYGVFLEALVLLALAVLFSTFARPFMVVTFCIGLFLIGHWLDSLSYFSGKSGSIVFSTIGTIVTHIVPNLEKLNWRSFVVYDASLAPLELVKASGYVFVWLIFLITLTALIFSRKDFG